jgi:hypothetical protein
VHETMSMNQCVWTCFSWTPSHLPQSIQHLIMSDPKRPRASRNRYTQAESNDSLAKYLASRNLPVPSSLKRPPQSDTCPSRSNKRHQVSVERDDTPVEPLVRSNFFIILGGLICTLKPRMITFLRVLVPQ